MIERALVALASLAAAAAFAVAFTAAQAEDELFGLQFGRSGPAELRRGAELERDAGRLTAGERRALLLANVRLRAGDAAGALALARRAAGREPENAEAWLAVSRAAREVDPALARLALQRLRELVPPVPAP